MGEDSVSSLEAKEYIEQSGQKAYHLTIPSERTELKKHYHKSDFGYLEDDFVIAIVGSRIETEIDGSFLN